MKQSKKPLLLSKSAEAPSETPLSPLARRFVKRVLNTVSKFDLWRKGDSLIIGVSGGPDSLCLLDVLVLLQKKYELTIHIAHVNYNLRKKDSLLDEQLVRAMARHYSLPSTVLSERKVVSFSEETLRDVRYNFFEMLRQKTNANHIVVAHNQDDQAETFLMRLLRGSGLSGLGAMRAKNQHLIRPLIEISRTDIMRYLEERKIVFREDQSNTDLRYFRNKIRHELIPFLEKNFQPQTKKLLSETALLLGEDYAFLQSIPITLPLTYDSLAVEFSRETILTFPQALIHREIRSLIKPLIGGKNPDKNLVSELIKALRSTKSKTQTITFKGLKFIRKGDRVRLLNF